MGRRLYLRLYLAFLGVLLGIVVVSAVVTTVLGRGFIPTLRRGPRIAAHLARTLPVSGDPAALMKAVEQAGDELGLDVAVVDHDGPDDLLVLDRGYPAAWLVAYLVGPAKLPQPA